MSMQNVMEYLRRMREGRGLTQAEIARTVGVDPKQVYRWERGESEPSGAAILTFIATVQGSYEEVTKLLMSSSVTSDVVMKAVEREIYDQHLSQPKGMWSLKTRSKEGSKRGKSYGKYSSQRPKLRARNCIEIWKGFFQTPAN